MSFETTRQLIAAHLATITTLGFPVQKEGGKAVGPAPIWGRWTILQGATEPATVGASMTRGTGSVILQIFVQEEGGTKPFTAAADIVAAALDRRQLRSGNTLVSFDTTGLENAGSEDGYTQKNLACNFTRDTYA